MNLCTALYTQNTMGFQKLAHLGVFIPASLKKKKKKCEDTQALFKSCEGESINVPLNALGTTWCQTNMPILEAPSWSACSRSTGRVQQCAAQECPGSLATAALLGEHHPTDTSMGVGRGCNHTLQATPALSPDTLTSPPAMNWVCPHQDKTLPTPMLTPPLSALPAF